MGLVLKHVVQAKSGSFHYRRRIPRHLKDIIAKTEFKRFLGRTENEALSKYPSVHSECERLLKNAERQSKGQPPLPEKALTELQAHYHLIRRLQELGFDPFKIEYDDDGLLLDEAARSVTADAILDSYPIDKVTGEYIGVTTEDAALVRALHSPRLSRPAPTLTDAKELYLKHKLDSEKATDGGGDWRAKDNLKKRQRAGRVIAMAIKALGGDRKITDIRRKDARDIVDQIASDHTAATAQRYLTDLKAMVSHAIVEEELGIASPFRGLSIKVEGDRKDERTSVPEGTLEDIRKQLRESGNKELQWIWMILEYSGCRLSEVTGLMKADVAIDGEAIPYIRIRPNELRSLKTASSIREIPLQGDALEAVTAALKASEDSPYLFPHYAVEVHKDAASAALMKHVRAVTSDKKVTVHSLRHNVADRLRLAGVIDDVIKMALGHAGKGITDRYGSREARLKIVAEALQSSMTDRTD